MGMRAEGPRAAPAAAEGCLSSTWKPRLPTPPGSREQLRPLRARGGVDFLHAPDLAGTVAAATDPAAPGSSAAVRPAVRALLTHGEPGGEGLAGSRGKN